MQFWSDYGLFLAKISTVVFAILLITVTIILLLRKGKLAEDGKLQIKKLNEKYDDYQNELNTEILNKSAYKKYKKNEKALAKKAEDETKKRIFVLEFDGDIKASAVANLREEISAILCVAAPDDEVVLCLESGGGMIAHYGLAASQLRRLREKKIPLTVIVDKVAASGGYLMACVAEKIVAAPFSIIGSIGVLAQLPNFHRYLKSKDIDFEQLTAGNFKRTLTMFGENTDKARHKMQEELEEIHSFFKEFIQKNRPQVNVDKVATGEHWLGMKALELNLVDHLSTSDDYLLSAREHADIYQINFATKKTMLEKFCGKLTSHFSSAIKNNPANLFL